MNCRVSLPTSAHFYIYIYIYIETENSNSIEQYLDGTIKIRFDYSKPRLPPLLKYTNSCHSFSESSSTSKRDQGINEYSAHR